MVAIVPSFLQHYVSFISHGRVGRSYFQHWVSFISQGRSGYFSFQHSVSLILQGRSGRCSFQHNSSFLSHIILERISDLNFSTYFCSANLFLSDSVSENRLLMLKLRTGSACVKANVPISKDNLKGFAISKWINYLSFSVLQHIKSYCFYLHLFRFNPDKNRFRS